MMSEGRPVAWKKPPRRVVVFLLMLLFGVAGFIGYRLLRFWNLRQDLQVKVFSKELPSPRLPFVDGLEGGGDGSKLHQSLLSLTNYSEDAVFPGSCSDLLTLVPESGRVIPGILERVEATLASFPIVPWDPSPKVRGRYGLGIPYTGEAPSYWTFLALVSLGNRPSFDVARVLVGVALIAVHIEANDHPFPSLGARYVCNIIRDGACKSLVECAAGLRLSREECARAVMALQLVERMRVPLVRILENDLSGFTRYGEYLASEARVQGPRGWVRWPGKVLSEMLEDPEILHFRDRQLVQPLLELASSSWKASNPEMTRLLKGQKASQASLAGSDIRIWMNYSFDLRSYLETWIKAFGAVNSIVFIRQDLLSRQNLRMAQWALALFSFRAGRNSWPESPRELGDWVGIPLPGDLFSGGQVLFRPGNPPDIQSVGPDQIPFTFDDLLAVASGAISVTSVLEEGGSIRPEGGR